MLNTNDQTFKLSQDWQKLKSLCLAKGVRTTDLGHYDLVNVLVDKNGKPLLHKFHPDDVKSFFIFTDIQKAARMARSYTQREILSEEYDNKMDRDFSLKTFALGELIQKITHENPGPSPLKINPINWKEEGEDFSFLLCEDVLFAPHWDQVTQKKMMTDPESAKALLAINPEDEKRFGMSFVFHVLTASDLPEDESLRREALKKEVEKLKFYTARTPIGPGSTSLYCVLLNLENSSEEMAFIRSYKCFNPFSSPIFVTSSLELFTGELETISYDGERIDGIFIPLINYQRKKREGQNANA